jgi:hypothetical protein
LIRDKVGPLSRGMILFVCELNPYPPHYKTAFAFSTFLCPHPHRLPLREKYGLTTFHAQTIEWVRFRLFAGGASSAVRELETLTPGHLPFGPSLWALLSALQHLWLVSVNDVYQRFTCVNHTIHPGSRPLWCSQSSSPPHGWMTTLVGVRLHCPKSFAPPDCSSRTSW